MPATPIRNVPPVFWVKVLLATVSVPGELPWPTIPLFTRLPPIVPCPPRNPPGLTTVFALAIDAIDNQASAVHGGRAGVRISAGQRERAGAQFDDTAHAADRARKGYGIASIERQSPVVEDISGNAASGSPAPDLERSGTDRCPAVLELFRSSGLFRSRLQDATRAADVPRKGQRALRSKASVPLSATFPVILPVVPSLPSCSVPALIVVPPANVLAPVRIVGSGAVLVDTAVAANVPRKLELVAPVKG